MKPSCNTLLVVLLLLRPSDVFCIGFICFIATGLLFEMGILLLADFVMSSDLTVLHTTGTREIRLFHISLTVDSLFVDGPPAEVFVASGTTCTALNDFERSIMSLSDFLTKILLALLQSNICEEACLTFCLIATQCGYSVTPVALPITDLPDCATSLVSIERGSDGETSVKSSPIMVKIF